MIKRKAIIPVIILLAGVLILGYFLNRNRKAMVADPYKLIGTDAAIIIETYDLGNLVNSLSTGKGLVGELKNIDQFGEFNSCLQVFADQVNKPGFRKFFQEGTALLSFHLTEDNHLTPFLSKSVAHDTGLRQMKEAFISSGITNFVERKSAGKKILIIPYNLSGRADSLYFSANSGLIAGSGSLNLLLKALSRTSGGDDIRNLPEFSRIFLSTGKKADKVFFVFSNLKPIAVSLFSNGSASAGMHVESMTGCSGGDFFLNEEGITLSGYSEITSPSGSAGKYRRIQPLQFRSSGILPSATSFFKSSVFIPDDGNQNVGGIHGLKLQNLANELLPYLGREITKAYIDIKGSPVDRNSVVIYELKNRMQCEIILTRHLGDRLRRTYFRPDDHTGIPVYSGGYRGLAEALMPGFAAGFNDSCFTFHDNYLVTGNSTATLTRFLYDNMLNKTLSNDIYYRDFEKTIPTRAAFLFYCVPSDCLDYLAGFLNEKIIKAMTENRSSLDKIESIGFQLAPINEMTYSNLSVNYRDVVREQSETEWETLLDTTAAIKPFFFTNHNTGAKEIFIQDARNNIYLINAAGRVLWKVAVGERINGPVYMIDYYRNGKYQLLFSGKDHLHLIDRNGNYVSRYPVKLRSPATSSLALFDFDNNFNYRLIIAGEDKQVYAYDKSGSVVKGWEPFRTAGTVVSEIGYFKVSGKDFIVVSDESSIYFLDRSGKERFRPHEAITRASGSALRLAGGASPALVCTAPDGTVQTISFNGNVQKFRIREFTPEHNFEYFDIDGDGTAEYIFIDNGILYLFDHNHKEIFSRDFSSSQLGGPINFIFSARDRKIGVFDIDRSLIYLIDGKGKVMNGFPLRGASMFSIGKLGPSADWNLIVGGTDRFLYNYKLKIPPG